MTAKKPTKEAGKTKAKGGRPRISDYLRKELWEARRVAREAYGTWKEIGMPDRVSQKQFSLQPRILLEDQARLNKWFPLILVSKKPHQWNLSVLGPIMRWDDPVVMLKEMIGGDPAAMAWWSVLKDVEENVYTQTQEETIRDAFRSARGGDIALFEEAFPSYKKNLEARKR